MGEKLELRKPNQIIEILGAKNITQLKILSYNYILHRLQKEKRNHMKIMGADIFNALGISKNYEEVAEYLGSLSNIIVESRDIKGRLWEKFSLLSHFKKEEDGFFYVEIPTKIFEALCKQEEQEKEKLYYTTLNLLEQKLFKSVYTSIFYEIFKKYEGINIPIFTVDELKDITETYKKYPQFKDLKRYVLDKAISELNQYETEYIYSYEAIKFGRKVDKIKFIREYKLKNAEIIKTVERSEKLEKAIDKVRKNRFIDQKYSEKSMEKLIGMYDEKDIIKALNFAYSYNQEIKTFYGFMKSAIEDIINSKKSTPGISSAKEDLKEIISEIPKQKEIQEEKKEKIKVTLAEYEEVKKDYLKKAQVTGDKIPPHIKRALTRHMNNYEVIGEEIQTDFHMHEEVKKDDMDLFKSELKELAEKKGISIKTLLLKMFENL